MIRCKVSKCSFRAVSGLSYIRHFNSHHRSGPKSLFICGYGACTRRFSLYGTFATHLLKYHNYNKKQERNCLSTGKNEIHSVEAASMEIACEYCNKVFHTYTDIQSHIKLHFDGSSIINCPHQHCEKKYVLLNSFSNHLSKQHPRKIPFPTNVRYKEISGVQLDSEDNDTIQEQSPILNNTDMPVDTTSHKKSLVCNLGHLYLSLVSKSHVPESTIQVIHSTTATIMDSTLHMLKEDLARRMSVHLDASVVESTLHDVFNEHLEGGPWTASAGQRDPLRSIAMRRKFYEENFRYISPIEMRLGKNKINRECNYHYVPIIDSLQALLADKTVYTQYLENAAKICTNTDNDGNYVFTDIDDGTKIKSHPLFSVDKSALQIILFQDEFLIANPLGASKKELKMLGVYYTLGNIHPWHRSKVDSIQLVSICRSTDFKYFHQSKVFKRMIDDLKVIETTGLRVQGRVIQGAVAFIIGDNLGSHVVGGFMENFSAAHYFCRVCKIKREDFRSGDMVGPLRTPENYNTAITTLAELPDLESFEGVKFNSIFNSLSHFHVIDGMPPCIGHDLFEGIAQYDIPLALHYFQQKQWFTIDYLNRRIGMTKFLGLDSSDKPSMVSDSVKLGGHAVQTWTLIRMLPLFIGHKIKDKEDAVWQMLLDLILMVQIICSPRLNYELIALLSRTTVNYLILRKSQFPNTPLRPKHHYILHYPRLISIYGPLIRLWTMRFESKHQFLKECQRSSKNTKNVTKTLSIRHQYLQASYAENGLFGSPDIVINCATEYCPELFSKTINEIIANQFDFHNSVLQIGTSCTIRGIKYRKDDLVTLKSYLVLNMLRIILIVLKNNEDVFFIGKVTTGNLISDLQLYDVTEADDIQCHSMTSLQDYQPYHIYKTMGFSCIALKHLTC